MSTELQQYMRYKNNPWLFLTECVKTQDQVDRQDPIKLFPNKRYLQLFTKVWQKYPLIAVPKSRRMTMSWTTLSLIAWEVIFFKGVSWACVSKKEDDANELIKRIAFILKNIDPNKLHPDFIPQFKIKFNLIELENDSNVRGFPQGADQLRQFTFSGIFGDESAFWEQAQAFYSASLPTIDGGGKMVLVSSPAPGFFKKLCFDQFNRAGDFNIDETGYEPQVLVEGIRFWQNKKNKFLVFELHYTADPEKRHPEYSASLKATMPQADYLREYELFWDTFQGQPVFPEFSRNLHVISDEEPVPVSGLPMLVGFDFGLTPAAVVAQYEDGVLTVFREYIEVNMGAERFIPKVVADIKARWPSKSDLRKDWLCFIDPSGNFRNDKDEGACAQTVAKNGFTPIPGEIAFEKRRQGVAHFLTRISNGKPAFQIYARRAGLTTKGLEGGYRYEDKHFDVEPGKLRPIKDQYSHPQDALQYICGGILHIDRKMRTSIPKPEYTFTNKQRRIG